MTSLEQHRRNARKTIDSDTAGGPLPLQHALVDAPDRFPRVRVVRDSHVLAEIGKLRYHQYVEGQGKAYSSIALDPRCLIESQDSTSVNIYAKGENIITCAMRIGELVNDIPCRQSLFSDLAHRFGIDIGTSLTCTRLVRAPSHNGRHVIDLLRFVRWQAVHGGWRYCMMQTAERLVPFFRKCEFVETGVWTDDEIAGRLQVMIIDTRMNPIQGLWRQ